jgi:hypothetical protein
MAEIQRTDSDKYAMLPISRDTRWAVWQPIRSNRFRVTIYTAGERIRGQLVGPGDMVLVGQSNEQISKWEDA